MTLKGNYKWMPATDVEFDIKIDGDEKAPIIEASNYDTKNDVEKDNSRV
jgi:hypothetical protein